ncbi:MAG: hypothetical protein Q8Q03_00790 [bacterium]|nr:hypothetical protein [bacterium]
MKSKFTPFLIATLLIPILASAQNSAQDYNLSASREPTTQTTVAGVISVSWNKISESTGYQVYRHGGESEILWTTIPQPAHGTKVNIQDTGLIPGALYGYRVVAQTSSGALESSRVYSQFSSERLTAGSSSAGSRAIASCGVGETEILRKSTPGTHTWTVPSGLSSVKVKIWGAGGGGGGAGMGGYAVPIGINMIGGGGGGGGGFSEKTLNVISGASYTLQIGKGGDGGANGGINRARKVRAKTNGSILGGQNPIVISDPKCYKKTSGYNGLDGEESSLISAALSLSRAKGGMGGIAGAGDACRFEEAIGKGGEGIDGGGRGQDAQPYPGLSDLVYMYGGNGGNGAMAGSGGGVGGFRGDYFTPKGKPYGLTPGQPGDAPAGGGGGGSGFTFILNDNYADGGKGGDGLILICSPTKIEEEKPIPALSLSCAPGETEIYRNNNSGTTGTWIAPSNAIAKVKVWGGGGGGGTGYRYEADRESRGGSGGGGGGYAESLMAISAGEVFNITVGNGGIGHYSQYPRRVPPVTTVFPAGNSEFIKNGVVLVGAGGGGGGGLSGLPGVTGINGSDGKGKGGVVGGEGAGPGGVGESGGAYGGKGGSGYVGDIKLTGGTAEERTIDRGDNEDSTPGAAGANGGSGGLAGRCGRSGLGHHCTTSSTLISGYRVSSAQDGSVPAGGGGGSSTGWNESDTGGYGATGQVLICSTKTEEEPPVSGGISPSLSLTCSKSLGNNRCLTGTTYNLSGTVTNSGSAAANSIINQYKSSTNNSGIWENSGLPPAGTITDLLGRKTQPVTPANNLPIGPVNGLTYRFKLFSSSGRTNTSSGEKVLIPASTLNITIAGKGTVTERNGLASSCSSACTTIFTSPSTVTLVATPAEGYVFSGWSEDCGGSETCILNMANVRNATATFTSCTTCGTPPPGGGGGGSSVTIRQQIVGDQILLNSKKCYLKKPSDSQPIAITCGVPQSSLPAGTYTASVDPIPDYSVVTWERTGNTPGEGIGHIASPYGLGSRENAVFTFTYEIDPVVTLKVRGDRYGEVTSYSNNENHKTNPPLATVTRGRSFQLSDTKSVDFDRCEIVATHAPRSDLTASTDRTYAQSVIQDEPLVTYTISCDNDPSEGFAVPLSAYTKIKVQAIDPEINEF